MDLNEIKKLIEEDGGKIIIVEDGEPVMVITSFAEYKKGRAKTEPKVAPLKEKDPKPLPAELKSEELKIEDLPF